MPFKMQLPCEKLMWKNFWETNNCITGQHEREIYGLVNMKYIMNWSFIARPMNWLRLIRSYSDIFINDPMVRVSNHFQLMQIIRSYSNNYLLLVTWLNILETIAPPEFYNARTWFFKKIEFGINFISRTFVLPLDLKTSRFKQPF